tara:strand:- start:734 stop:931 length:198 start_codon:yes stop_codon:yes gene_type:complete
MDYKDIVDIKFLEDFVELKILISVGHNGNYEDNTYIYRKIEYDNFKLLAKKLKKQIDLYYTQYKK